MLSHLSSFAQTKRTHHWHFYKEAALDFTSGTAVTDLSGKTKVLPSPIPSNLSAEGTTTMSDTSGNLLFYSDGITVWDSTHQIMKNGEKLHGHWSASRGVIAIPHPGNTNQYYLFTLDQTTNSPYSHKGVKGLHYSIIDMSLNNGKGAIISNKKNILITDKPYFAEKLGAIQKMDGGYWLVAYAMASKSFYAYGINTSGLNLTPTISQAGYYTGVTYGMLTFSPSGKTLVQIALPANRLEIYDFDLNSGKVSARLSIHDARFEHMSGQAFSLSGEFLYIGGGDLIVNITPTLYQIDLRSSDSTTIHNSLTLIHDYQDTTRFKAIGNVQLGPDGKIYVATIGSTSLGIVNQPNLSGMACNYSPLGISLMGRKNAAALPNFVVNWIVDCNYIEQISLGRDTTLCPGEILRLRPNKPFTSVIWQDGSNDKRLVISQPGIYTARIQRLECVSYDTIVIDYFPSIQNELGQDITLCPEETLLLTAKEGNADYSWQDGTTNSDYLANASGTYSLTTTVGLCSQSDTLQLSYFEPPIFNLGSDTTIYSTDGLQLDASSSDPEATYHWSDGFNSPTRSISIPGLYIVEVRSNDCTFSDSILIEVADLIIPNIITPNGDGINESFIIRGSGYEQWNLQIFDRYGRPVYKSDNYQSAWQATGLEAGTYYYALIDQKTTRVFKGWVLVVR